MKLNVKGKDRLEGIEVGKGNLSIESIKNNVSVNLE